MTDVLVNLTPSLPGTSKHLHEYAMSAEHGDPDWRQQQYYHHQAQQPQPQPQSTPHHQQPSHPLLPLPSAHQLGQLPMLSGPWTTAAPSSVGGHAPILGGMNDVDLRMFQPDHQAHYTAHPASYSGTSQLLSPSMSYVGDTTWTSEVDMTTPSTAGFPTDIPDAFHSSLRLQSHTTNPNQSPHSSIEGYSPHTTRGMHTDLSRPSIGRSITAPDQQRGVYSSHRRANTDITGYDDLGGQVIKRSDGSDDGEDDATANMDDTIKVGSSHLGHRASTSSAISAGAGTTASSNRGRKRQRIPHTAVERRYRENLNAHLEKLRQTVPAFNQPVLGQVGARGDEVNLNGAAGEGPSTMATAVVAGGMRPSKCEVLNGAIEHISCLDRENGVLKAENKALRQKLEEVERWYHQQQQHGAGSLPINR